jgi:thiol-disulfide isomerase/thioredoxin/uncharacterized membrane protein YphA (DoxX/SURF4 family)
MWMGIIVLALRLMLAALFAVAAVAKLADPRGSARALSELGLPSALTTPARVLLPVLELAVALSLVVPALARVGAAGALVLLLMFSAAAAWALAHGRRPDCHCFGGLHSRAIGPGLLVRNGLFSAVAGVVVWYGPGDGLSWWLSPLTPVVAVVIVGLGALVTAQAWLAINLLRQNGRILMRLEVHPGLDPSAGPAAGLPIGSRAPEFPLLDVAGHLTTGASLPDAAPVMVVVFTAPGCGPCHALLPELASWQREHAGRLGMAVISHGSADQAESIAAEYELSGMLADPSGATARAYRVHGTPTAVLIDAQGRIASPLTEGPDAIRRLITDIVHRPLPLHR